ncbi:MAG: argininosuccinate lyase [Nitrososphaera sp.]
MMYRSRPKGELDSDALDFLSSMQEDKAILGYDILGTEAHVLMLHKQKYLTAKELKAVLAALELAKSKPLLIRTEGFEDIHEALEGFVATEAGTEAGGKMHTARSRNDQVALDTRMKIRDDINLISSALLDLVEVLIRRAKQNKCTVMLFYTHLQQAQIGTLSHYFLAFAYSLLRDVERLSEAYRRVNRSPLGSCAILGTSMNIDREFTARTLGFDGLVVNSLDATSSRDVLLEYASDLTLCMNSISRVAEDLVLWSSTEFGYIELDDSYSSTSSAMPQKKNPDPLEMARAKAGSVIGDCVSLLAIVKSLPSGYDRDLQEFKQPLFRMSKTVLDTLRVLKGVVDTLQIRHERMEESCKNSYAIALDVAERLVSEQGIPFRAAHKIVGAVVNEAISKGHGSLRGLSEADIKTALLRARPKEEFDVARIHKVISEMTPEKSVRSKKSQGSPSPKEQAAMIDEVSEAQRKQRAALGSRISLLQEANANLEKIVAELTK